MRDYSKEPVFKKKAEDATAFLEKHPLTLIKNKTMAQKTVFRLVTQEDLDNNPDLIKQGVSVNQMHDFPVVDKGKVEEKKKPAAKEADTKKEAPKKEDKKK